MNRPAVPLDPGAQTDIDYIKNKVSKRLILWELPSMRGGRDGSAVSEGMNPPPRRGACVPTVALEFAGAGCTQHQLRSTSRQLRVLTVTTRIGAVVSVFFGIQQFVIAQDALWLGYLNLGSAIVFLLIPQLYRFGDLLPPVVFLVVAYTAMTVSSTYVGSGIGLHFYFAVAAAIVVLVLGIEHIVLASFLAALGAVLVIALELRVPHNTGTQPDWRSRWASSSTPSRHGSWWSQRSGMRCARSPGPSAPWRPNTNARNRCWPTSCPRPSRNA
jgi:hypothetical protein